MTEEQERKLKQLKIEVTSSLLEKDLDNFSIEYIQDWMTRSIFLKWKKFVMVDQLIDEPVVEEYEVPTSWWEMFKRDILKRKNIKTEKKEVIFWFHRYRVYPNLPPIPREKHFYMENIEPLGELKKWPQ